MRWRVQFPARSFLEPNVILSALRLRLSPCASLLLACLRESCGALALIHESCGPGSGVVSWRPESAYLGSSQHVRWAALKSGTLYVHEADLAHLQSMQLVLDVAFGGDAERGIYTDARIVSLYRPLYESELDLLRYAAHLAACEPAHAAQIK